MAALTSAWPALAQEPRSEGTSLRWADVAAAIQRDPRVAASRSRVRSAEGAVSAARTPPNPQLEASAGRASAREVPLSRDEWSLAISIPLDWLARRGPEIDAARAGADELRAEAEALRAEVSAHLWRLFVRAAYAQSEVETLETTEQQVESLSRLVRRRVEAGEARPVEVPRVEVEVERVRNEVAAARAARDGALAQLGAWLAVPVRRVEPPPSPPAPDGPAADVARHPRVRAALARAAAARAEASAARRSRIPAVSVGVLFASELDREAVAARVGVELPLWDWKGGRIRRAEASAEAEASRADAEERDLAAALADAGASCARARAVADRQKGAILPRAEESAHTLERAFQLGETGILDVIDARRVLLDARRQVLSSASERDLECGTLILLSGRELT